MSDRDELENLRREFIVDEGTYEKARLKSDLPRLLKHCKTTSQGKVLFISKGLTDKSKIGLVVIARYIGNKLNTEIPETVDADDIAAYTGVKKDVVNARGKELVDEGFATRQGAGQYRANPGRVTDFLDTIDKTLTRKTK